MIGYDNLRFNHEMLLDLQFQEGTGAVTQDWAKAHHADPTITLAAWSNLANDLTYLTFLLTGPDFITILAADTADLNFTSGDFSGAAWFYPTAAGNRLVFNKGTGTTGWHFANYGGAGVAQMQFATFQAGPTYQITEGPDISLNAWHFVGFTRDGAAARVYEAGRDATTVYGTHVNPASAAANNFYIGRDNGGAGMLDGYLWRPRIWGRCLAAAEMLAIYEAERDLFGV
jgi:hypothetical protein